MAIYQHNFETTYSLQEIAIYLRLERYHHALEKLLPLVVEEPDNGELHYLMAEAQLGLHQQQEALNYCASALCNGYSRERCYLLQGEIYLSLRWYGEAEQSFTNVLQENPQNAAALAYYGYVKFKLGHKKQARQLFEEAFNLQPLNPVVLRKCFYYYLVQTGREDLQSVLDRYWKSPNREVQTLVMTGVVEIVQGKYSSARDRLKKAFHLEPACGDLTPLIQELSQKVSPWYIPHRLASYVGGAFNASAIGVTLIVLLGFVGYRQAAIVIAIAFGSILLYSWLVAGIERILLRREQASAIN